MGQPLRITPDGPRDRRGGLAAVGRLRGGKNRFYRANRDLGRVLKTEFILQYLSEPALRGRIRRSLLKVEQLDALARDVFYGRRGRINARELWEQMNTLQLSDPDPGRHRLLAGAGNLAGLKPMRPCPANGVDLSLLEHVSPIELDNVVLYGQYPRPQARSVSSWDGADAH
jgi:Tn3 transposase DDE domain